MVVNALLFSLARTEAFIKVEGIMNILPIPAILVQNIQASLSKLQIEIKHNNDPKHTSNLTKEWLN